MFRYLEQRPLVFSLVRAAWKKLAHLNGHYRERTPAYLRRRVRVDCLLGDRTDPFVDGPKLFSGNRVTKEVPEHIVITLASRIPEAYILLSQLFLAYVPRTFLVLHKYPVHVIGKRSLIFLERPEYFSNGLDLPSAAFAIAVPEFLKSKIRSRLNVRHDH
jgi:hypothetical protein